jgi:hypothetical protein
MKRPLLTLIFGLATFSAFSQITRIDTVKADDFVLQKQYRKVEIQNSYTFTIGANIFALEQFPKILNQTNGNDLHTSFLNGVILKYNDNQISYRFSGSLSNETTTFNNECEDCEETTGKIQDYQISAGFEKSILYTRVQPYFGAEIGYRSNRFKGSSKAAGGTYSVTPYDVLAEKKGATLTPLAGIRLNLVNHLTLSSEAGFDIFYSYERQEKTFQDNNRTRTLQTYRKLEFLPRPLASLSLQYNFGMND